MTFSPVTTGAPAIGGNADNLESYASDYTDAAQTIREAAEALAAIADDRQFVSLAIDEVAEKITEAAAETEQIAVRFEGAAGALALYAKTLRTEKAAASTATSNFDTAVTKFWYWDNKQTEITLDIQSGVGDLAQLTTDLTYATGRVSYWRSQVTASEGASMTAHNNLDDAATIAINAIDAAMAASKLNDSFADDWNGFWEGVYEWCQEYLAPILEVIADLAEIMSTIAGWLAFALTIASVFLPFLAPLAGLMGTIALVLLAVSVVASALLMFLGKMTVAEFAGRTIKLAVSFVLSKFGPLGAVIKSSASGLATSAANALPGYLAGAPVLGQSLYTVVQGVGGPVIEKVVKDGVKNLVNTVYEASPGYAANQYTLELYPSAGGPDWNVPPLPSVDYVGTGALAVALPTDQTATVCTPS